MTCAQENNIIINKTISDNNAIKEFFNITITSNPEIEITKEIIPGSSILFIPAVDKDNITILLDNLPNKDLYFYVDSLEHGIKHSVDQTPSIIFTLNGREPHLIFIKSNHSTKIVKNDSTGGSCSTFGVWDQSSLTCTMTQDVFEAIEIASDGITLDGNKHMVKWGGSSGIGSGINIAFKKNITVKNLIVSNFDYAFGVFQTSNNKFLNNETHGYGMGFYISYNVYDNVVDGNLIINTEDNHSFGTNSGIYLGYNVFRTVVRNNTISVTNYGLAMTSGAYNNKVYNNNFMNSVGSIVSGSSNTIYQQMPIGGNYYRNYDTPNEGCNDFNSDFICDNSKSFGNVTDNFPWIYKDGWKGKSAPDEYGYSNVLFIPGLEASRLYLNENGSENQLWEPNRNLDVEKLYLNTDGTSVSYGVYARDIIKETNTPFSTGFAGQNIYKSFSKMLDDLTNKGLPKDERMERWEAYAYDWRQGVEGIVNNGTQYKDGNKSLVETLKNLVASSTTGKVTVIAHSNGGLIAKALMIKLQEMKNAGTSNLIDKIDNLILVAVPQIGTATAVPTMLHGYDQSIVGGWIMDEMRAREFGRNMPGAYGLLPSREYINRMSASPIVFTDNATPSFITTSFLKAYGNVIDSYSEYKDFIFGNEGRAQPPVSSNLLPINLSQSLFTVAENLHNKIDSWTPPIGLRLIEVAGWGLDTVASFEYYPKWLRCDTSYQTAKCINIYTLDEKPIFTADGDKTVVEPSALYGVGEKMWINLKEHNNELLWLRRNREHKDILEVDQLNNFISSLIKNETPIYDLVLTSSKPIDTSNRLRISIHSPVTLGAYDSLGNFTGKVCPPTSDFCYVKEEIPNSSYLEFGEGKYINLPEENMQKIVLQGTDTGTFMYESAQVLPDGRSATTTFIDIPVTAQTKVEVTLNNTQTPQLALDVNGDGVKDFTITPEQKFDPVLFLQIMRKIVESFTTSKDQKEELFEKIDDIIKLIQKGKTNEVKQKLEEFIKKLTVNTKECDEYKCRNIKRISNKLNVNSIRDNREGRDDVKDNEGDMAQQLSQANKQVLLTMLNQLLNNLNK